MPTSQDENDKILRVALEFLPPERLRELLERLWEEVGAMSPNASVKESLRTLRRMAGGAAGRDR